ncbi:MAG: ADP-ribosylglycohydrolase family protein [Chloroflexi bacterium]|nr:ADP-ribosylglycohydrolase family protein [Chloroflexota bacterium]
MPIPSDYLERVYAGVLGKVIGVYVGSPIEGWDYARIMREVGEVNGYLQERLGRSLILPDDDISGTFTFVRALQDYGYPAEITSQQVAQTWLNYLVENKSVLWWGGMGRSTEHTAYLRLRAGIQAPESGSIALNGPVVAEQIGAQIFIDAWGLAAPGDPARAAQLAYLAARVSHDGEAVYGAQVIAAMVAAAFNERDMGRLLDIGLAQIPEDCLIARLIADIRAWHAANPDWHATRALIESHYGYDRYGGGCHIIPNHALVIMALLYGAESFQRALMIVNTSGWDTDCNSANVGCLMGVRLGLEGINAEVDFRTPVADRIYIPTADGGRVVTDAVREAVEVAAAGCALAGVPFSASKGGARFHFDLPGALQGFAGTNCQVENVAGHSGTGAHALAIRYDRLASQSGVSVGREAYPATRGGGYHIEASPTLYSGQLLWAAVSSDAANCADLSLALAVQYYDASEQLATARGEAVCVKPGEVRELSWRVRVPDGCPIAWVGLELAASGDEAGTLYLDWLTWEGAPEVRFTAPKAQNARWMQAWVLAADDFIPGGEPEYWLWQNTGTGMVIQGLREWRDYTISACFRPHLARSFGLAARVQGLKRYYALQLAADGNISLIRELDGTRVLYTTAFNWELYRDYALTLQVAGSCISAWVDGELICEVDDPQGLAEGAIGLMVEEGRVGCGEVCIRP